jgi:xylulokinase
MYLIGIDIGTSGTKSVIFDETGRALGSALSEYGMSSPKNGWAEQNPEDWWGGVAASVRGAIAKAGIDASGIAGVGLSGQMHGLVLLDENDEVVRPSIIWCDQRTAAEAAELTALVGAQRLLDITANPALTGFTAAKLLWVEKNEPDNFRRVKKIMLPKDYIRLRLTGEFATEVSDASGMQLMNVRERKFSPVMLDALNIKESMLGKMYESCEVTGRVTAKAAAETGLAAGTIVVGGAGDQAASAVGCGIVREGILSCTVGTSGVVFAHTDNMLLDPKGRVHTLCHAVPGKWHIMGVTQAAGMSFKWLRDSLFAAEVATAEELGVPANKLLDDIAARVPAGADRLVYLPYLMGERTPHLDSDARGAFIGLTPSHGKPEMLRAVLEGVVYSLRDCLEIIRGLGAEPENIIAAGGGANSKLWRQIMADCFGLPINVSATTEGGALGVAILAGVGAGIYKSVEDACASIIGVAGTTAPDASKKPVYDAGYAVYDAIYPALKDVYKSLASV